MSLFRLPFSSLKMILFCCSLCIYGCDSPSPVEKPDPGFTQYISAFTSGVISKKSSIVVRLQEPGKSFKEMGSPANDIFSFTPTIKGQAIWEDSRTLVFTPASPLTSGGRYVIEFNLSKVADVTAGFETFKHTLDVVSQRIEVYNESIKPYTLNHLQWNQLSGELKAADFISDGEAEMLVKVSQEGRELGLLWSHHEGGRLHYFTVDSIERKKSDSELLIEWSGKAIQLKQAGSKKVAIPAIDQFKVLEARAIQSPEQKIIVSFSDPLSPAQDIEGLFNLSGDPSIDVQIHENEVTILPSKRQTGTIELVVHHGLQNRMGYELKKSQTFELTFIEVKPAVQLLQSGVILPSTDGMVLPFKAVNLKAVDVEVIRVFEKNVTQFLQVNELDGGYQMARVGRKVWSGVMELDHDPLLDMGKWNRFTLDLKKIIGQEKGAIYKVRIGFKKNYSLYSCGDLPEDAEENHIASTTDEDWDYYEDDDYYYDYDWSERDNPCNPSYYRYKWVNKNILASDIGLIAKKGEDQSLMVAVTDLKSATPLVGADVQILDYQQQIIAKGKTNDEGLMNFKADEERQPWLLIAKNNGETGYLKLGDGKALSTSRFDVQGVHVQQGVKGYIYGERGVWRPGDTLFLSFILEDKHHTLPENHPVRLRLNNPLGQSYFKQVHTYGLNGFYTFKIPTDPDVPTGTWTAHVNAGGAKFSHPIRIETIKPNRLKIQFDLEEEMVTSTTTNATGTLTAKWLHGAKAKGLKAKVSAALTTRKTVFKGYEDYLFNDPRRRWQSDEHEIYEGKLDDEGWTEIPLKFKMDQHAPGQLNARIITRVYEQSGDFSIDRFSIPYSPFPHYVGIKTPEGDRYGQLVTDTNHTVQLVVLDEHGKPAANKKVTVQLYKIHWRWWWDASNDNLGNYIGSSYHNWKDKVTMETDNEGRIEYTLRVNYPDWGRFLITAVIDGGGHTTAKTVYMDWPGWVSRSSRKNPDGANMLTLTTDKSNYIVNEVATVTIPACEGGRALVTIENGVKVLQAQWINTTENDLQHTIPILPEMAPNCYVAVTIVQPHQHKNDLPMRLYGVVPLLVENPETRLNPVLKIPEKLEPEKTYKFEVSEREGKAMTYTVAIVDEGLLDLTRFKTPNAHPEFYAREALGVKTWDLYDDVIGAYGGTLERLLAVGGGDEAGGKANSRVNRFKPMVKFYGPFDLGAGKSAEHSVTLPNYIGSVRTMVVAGYKGAYGNAEQATPVKKPLMVLSTLPRVLGPGEKVVLPITVFAMEKGIQEVNVRVKTNDAIKVVGSPTKQIHFDELGEQVVNFKLQVAEKVTAGKVEVQVSSGSHTATHETAIAVRNPNPPVKTVYDFILDDVADTNLNYALNGIAGTNHVVMELSSLPPVDLDNRLKYLLQYPHGCVEQTTSKAFPQLFLDDVLDLKPAAAKRASDNVHAALNKLRGFQHYDGGFSYWPSGQQVSDWATSYVGHFIIEAERKGFTLPDNMKSNWLSYQSRAARQYRPEDYKDNRAYYSRKCLNQAQVYRLFTLALAGKPEIGAMNRMKTNKELSPLATWQLAASYHLAGQKEIARLLVLNLSTHVTSDGYNHYTYGSTERDLAMVLKCLLVMGRKQEAAELARSVSNALGAKSWMSTQTTAFCLMGISQFLGASETSDHIHAAWKIGAESDDAQTDRPVKQIVVRDPELSTRVYVQNKQKSPLFVRITSTGAPMEVAQKPVAQNLKIRVNYFDMNDRSIIVDSLEQGMDFYAEVTIENPNNNQSVRDIALTQIFPSGWEIRNARMDGTPTAHGVSTPDYQDIRDDRALTYFSLGRYSSYHSGQSKTFRVNLSATYLGEYLLPAASAEAMYDDKVHAANTGQKVWVVPVGTKR